MLADAKDNLSLDSVKVPIRLSITTPLPQNVGGNPFRFERIDLDYYRLSLCGDLSGVYSGLDAHNFYKLVVFLKQNFADSVRTTVVNIFELYEPTLKYLYAQSPVSLSSSSVERKCSIFWSGVICTSVRILRFNNCSKKK